MGMGLSYSFFFGLGKKTDLPIKGPNLNWKEKSSPKIRCQGRVVESWQRLSLRESSMQFISAQVLLKL